MATTVREIENRARMKLLDTYEDNYHFAPVEVFHAMRDGMRLIRKVRPESRYVSGLLTDALLVVNGVESGFDIPESYTPTTLEDQRASVINMEDDYMEALVYYVIHQMYLKDDTDTANAQLAQAYYNKFAEAVRS